MTDPLLAQGVELMLVGMGTVFLFLTALVFGTTLMSRVAARFSGDEAAADSPKPGAEEVAAIAAAISFHRRR